MQKSNLKIFLVFIFSLALGVGIAHTLRAEVRGGLYQKLDLFSDAVAILQNNYVRDVDMEEVIYGAIEGMLAKLDAHSSFLPPKAFEEIQVETQGEFGGIGIEVTTRDAWLTVVSPIEDTPADAAGIEAGDRIIAIEGNSTKDMDLPTAVERLRGKVGTKVKITVVRQKMNPTKPTQNTDNTDKISWSEPFDVTLTRAKIVVKSVRHELKDAGNILYVRLNQFQARTGEELRKVLSQEHADQKQGIILDLRNNPGGLLDQAIEVADAFVKEGKIVYTDGRSQSMKQTWYARNDRNEPDVPIVVLINGGTASASEIVAGALKDHQIATLLGSRSFGKGSVQTIIRLRDGSGLRLTTALYYTPSGISIQASGIQPDIDMEAVEGLEEFISREEDLARHIELDQNGKKMELKTQTQEQSAAAYQEKVKRQEALLEKIKNRQTDPILDRAIELIKKQQVAKPSAKTKSAQSAK